MLAWKNYNNSHVIFDASNSTSPSGGAVDRTNATNAWSAAYPTLMGWNGSTTYGVRVDSARNADNTTGTAASINGFGNPTTSATGGTIVYRDANGDTTARYSLATYFNSTDNSQTGSVSAIMVKAGDNYIRSGTAAAIATFISGQSMNIAGSSTSCSGNAATASNGGVTSVNGSTGAVTIASGAQAFIAFGSTGGY
jgi:hypothetical protein